MPAWYSLRGARRGLLLAALAALLWSGWALGYLQARTAAPTALLLVPWVKSG